MLKCVKFNQKQKGTNHAALCQVGNRLPHNVCGAVVVVAIVVVVVVLVVVLVVVVVVDVVVGLDVELVLSVSVIVVTVVGATVVARRVEERVTGMEVERSAGKEGPAGFS